MGFQLAVYVRVGISIEIAGDVTGLLFGPRYVGPLESGVV
jgi:hypothetical protein